MRLVNGSVLFSARTLLIALTVAAIVGTAQGRPAPSSTPGGGSRAPTVAITVPWEGNPGAYHLTWSGAPLVLQGTSVVGPGCTLTSAEWDPGDGSGFQPVSHADPRVLELTHAYAAPYGTPFVATLRVTDDCGTVATDTFRVRVLDQSLETEACMAIDRGLWNLHKNLTLSSSGGVDTGYWLTTWSSSQYTGTATGSAVLAMEVHGHLESGDAAEDPYVDDVRRGLAHLMALLVSRPISVQPDGDPDVNGNGIGLQAPYGQYPPYQGGSIVDAIVASNTPNAVAITGGADVLGSSYRDIVQDLLDCYSWGQGDGPAGHGGWRYSWNYSGSDNDVSRWWALATIPAERSFGCIVPQFVKDANLGSWIPYSQWFIGSNSGDDGRFGYTSWAYVVDSGINTTPSGLLQLTADGVQSSDARFQAAEHFMMRNWNTLLGLNRIYGMFSLAAAMSLASPAPIEIMTDGLGGSLDWYYSDTSNGDSVDGLARYLVNTQFPDGSWNGYWATGDFATALAVVILRPHFGLGPVAVIEAEPNPAPPNYLIHLDASGSYHLNPLRQIVAWDWDLDDDGTYDMAGPMILVSFPVPGDFVVRLRVTDDSIPPLISTDHCTLHILQDPGIGFCFGDPGAGTPCPCSNDNDGSVSGSGCANGAFPSGARLTASGIPSVSADTLVLATEGLDPINTGLYFQADNAVNGGDGVPFGDGLRCAGGGLIRLQVQPSDAAGASSTTIAIGVKGGVSAGDTKRYQCWYRDNSGGQPCGAGVNDFNLSNGYEISWLP